MREKRGDIALRFFSKKYLSKNDLKLLKRSLRRLVSAKYIDYNGNFAESVSFEKMVSVSPSGALYDEYLGLEKRCEDVWFDTSGVDWQPMNYDYSTLSWAFRRHMKELGERLYHRGYDELRNGVSVEDYNRRIERLISYNPAYTDDEFRDYVLLGKPIPTPEYKKAMDSARRAYKAVNAILKANINIFTDFVTLTFAPSKNKEKHLQLNRSRSAGEIDLKFKYADGTDFELVKEEFSNFIKNFRERLSRNNIDFKYICVWELQKNGNYHFHLLTTTIPNSEHYKVPEWLDYDHRSDRFEKGYGLISWEYGKSDVQKIKSLAQASSYISKYIIKSFYNLEESNYELYKGQKKYFCSRGLTRPIETYRENEEDIGKVFDYEFENMKPYEKEVINPYNDGKISTKIYTLIDKEKDAISEIAPTGEANINKILSKL